MTCFKSLIPLLIVTLAGCEDLQIGEQPAPEPQAVVEVLAFTASWCGPCQRNRPRVDRLRQQGVRVSVIDVDEYPSIAQQYGIHLVPTYIVLRDGSEELRTHDVGELEQHLSGDYQ